VEFDILGGLNASISKPSAIDMNRTFNFTLDIENILTEPIKNIAVEGTSHQIRI